jgi:cell division protein FtsQ
MPSVVRGGKRQGSGTRPTSKSTGAKGKRKAPPRRVAAGKLHALSAVGLAPAATAWAVLGLLVAGACVVLFTGGRAQALGAAVSQAVDGRLAAAGFRLKRVHLTGASAEALPAIEAALGVTKDEPLARLDLNVLRQRVEAVGWVKDARVVRLLPDTLVVAVTERERLAVWQHAGQAKVIDSEGRPIPEADPARFADLPLVVGEGADRAAAQILPLLRQRPRVMARLEALVRVDDRRWDLRLKDGALIQLPAQGEEAALLQLDGLDQRSHLLDLGFDRIDLKVPDMPLVRLRQEPGASGGSRIPPVAG